MATWVLDLTRRADRNMRLGVLDGGLPDGRVVVQWADGRTGFIGAASFADLERRHGGGGIYWSADRDLVVRTLAGLGRGDLAGRVDDIAIGRGQ